MRTGRHEEQFSRHTHYFSFITYSILWKWLRDDGSAEDKDFENNPLHRCSGVLLDEFADLPPKSAEACRLLGRLARGDTANGDELLPQTRIVVAGYGLCPAYVQEVLGQHEFLTITGRFHTLDRSAVFPKQQNADLLQIAAQLAVAALLRTGRLKGDVIIFLPGRQEIAKVQHCLQELWRGPLRIVILHSEVIGTEEERDVDDESPDLSANAPLVTLATVIGAKGVTLETTRYAIIFPTTRSAVLWPSGTSRLADERVSQELEGNKSGRVGRTSDGLVTLLYNVDDSGHALASFPNVQVRPQAMMSNEIATVVVGSRSRLHLVLWTVRHLHSRGFPNIFRVQTPEPASLDSISTDAKKRLMLCWKTTVLPALKHLWA